MSLSDSDDRSVPKTPRKTLSETEEAWGTIFTPYGESTLHSFERAKSTNWSPAEVEAYLDRVKSKATEAASAIINEARAEAARLAAQADEARAEAAALLSKARADAVDIAENARATAHEEGYAQGHEEAYAKTLADADEELQVLRSNMADAVSGVLASIEGQCSHIFDVWREDLIAICRLSVEKMVPVLLAEERANLLASLFAQSVATLERHQRFIIRVNPEDEPVITDIVETTKSKYPEISIWQVQANPAIEPGGLVVESESSLAESRIASRKAAVDAVLDHLTLPDSHVP